MKSGVIAGLVVGVLVLLGVAFYAGTVYGEAGASDQAAVAAPGEAGPGAAFGNMTEEQRAEMQNMTAEERQQFMAEQLGVDPSELPEGGQRGEGSFAGGPRGGILEGEVIEVATDTVTVALADGGSQTVYITGETVTAYADGAAELVTGAQVLLLSEPEADGVSTAMAIVVQ